MNQALVRRYFPAGDAIGRLMRIPRLRTAPFSLADDSFQIVGVVNDTVNRVSTNEMLPEMYLPYTDPGPRGSHFRAGRGTAGGAGGGVEGAGVRGGPRAAGDGREDRWRRCWRENAYARPRFNLLLFAVFAALGMALALFGIYGVISHSVAQQTREIGIRIALGASFGQVIGMVLGGGAKLLAIGMAVGLGASLASVKLLKGLVSNVSTFDPYSFAAVAVVLFGAGMFASFWPARRAAHVDPITALREQ